MNIICIGTLDKFSRFYLKIGKELTSNKVNTYVLSIHISGFLYTLLRFKFSCWISAKSWFLAVKNKKKYLKIIQKDTEYKNIPYTKLIKYHLNLSNSISKQNLLLQCLSYIDILESFILKKSPDLIILIGDSKLSIETCIAIAEKYNIETRFIEQGPFKTTIFESKGVNANASIRGFKLKNEVLLTVNKVSEIANFKKRPKTKIYNRSRIYRTLDLCFDFIFSKSYIYPPDLKFTDTFPTLKYTKPSSKRKLKQDKHIKSFLLILQIPMDVNMIYHSPYFKTHLDIVTSIHKNLPDNSKLIVREHPLYKNKYEKELYKYTKTNNIEFDDSKSLKESLQLTNVVIVNNSTVGIEAISLKKTVIVLGNSYYDNSGVCIKYTPKDDLKILLKTALNFKLDDIKLNAFLHEFLINYLIPGFITDNELNSAKAIAHKITSEIININN